MYPAKPPEGEWSYIVDDFGIAYRRGFWPFRRGTASEERREVAEFARKEARLGREWKLGEACGWTSGRLAPDTEYCAAVQNYVLVFPDTRVAWKAEAGLHLYVRKQGLGAITVKCEAEIDLRDFSVTLSRIRDDWPGELKAQAEEKAAKVAAMLREHVARCDAGRRRVETARSRWKAQTQ